jgi:hypothetical protein
MTCTKSVFRIRPNTFLKIQKNVSYQKLYYENKNKILYACFIRKDNSFSSYPCCDQRKKMYRVVIYPTITGTLGKSNTYGYGYGLVIEENPGRTEVLLSYTEVLD